MNIQNSLSDFQFITNNIADIQVKNTMFLPGKDTELKKCFDVDYEISNIEELDDRRFACVSLFLNINVSDEKSDKNFLDFFIHIDGIFSAPLDFSDELFIDTLELNGLTALYGVARGHISALSSAITSVEKINLPMINIRKLVDEKHKNSK